MLFTDRKRIYLDYASATPVRKEVQEAMEPYWRSDFGNAGAIHAEGMKAKAAVTEARRRMAKILRIREDGIVFTASGTESNNLAIMGTLYARHKEGLAYGDMEIISTEIEHPSVLETLKHCESLGVQVKYVGIDEEGLIDMEELQQLFSPSTVLISVAYANSEIGVVQEIGKISRTARSMEKKFGTRIYVHVDAAQAPLWLPCELDALGCDMLSLDAGKCYGPKGVGVLAYIHGVKIAPVVFGGSQEGGLRAGTENTALIVGAVEALAIAQKEWSARAAQVEKERDHFFTMLLSIPGCVRNGSQEKRLANNVNISIPGIDSEFAVVKLDAEGISASTKSACGGAKGDGSHVVRTMSGDDSRATSTIRFTLGEDTLRQDLEKTTRILSLHVETMMPFKNS